MSEKCPTQAQNPVFDILLAREALKDDSDAYNQYHHHRYLYLRDKCLSRNLPRHTKVLDIGPGHFTHLLLNHYDSVYAMGLDTPEHHELAKKEVVTPNGPKKLSGFIAYDLNDTQTCTPIPTSSQFDIIVIAEVIEHLYAAPELVLSSLRSVLSPDGVIICQTPNAAALHKRLQLLWGINPYERVRVNQNNPGHIREYTKAELMEIGEVAGLQSIEHEYKDYFDISGAMLRQSALYILRALAVIGPALSRGQTILYRTKPEFNRGKGGNADA